MKDNNMPLPDPDQYPYTPIDQLSYTGLMAGYDTGIMASQKQAWISAMDIIEKLGGDIGYEVAV